MKLSQFGVSNLIDERLNIHDTQARTIKARYPQSKICHRPMHHFCSVESATTLDVKCTSLKYGDRAGRKIREATVFVRIYTQRGINAWIKSTIRIYQFFFRFYLRVDL